MSAVGGGADVRPPHRLRQRPVLVGADALQQLPARERAARTLAGEEARLDALMARARLFDEARVEAAVLGGMDDRLQHRRVPLDRRPADEDGVAAAGDGLHRRLLHRPVGGDRPHLQIVGHDESAVAALAPQDAVDDGARQGRGTLFVERGIDHVRGHHRRRVRRDGGPERRHLVRAQPLRVVLDHRQLVVGIDPDGAVSRKVLGAGGHAAFLQAGDDARPESSHRVRIRRERPVPDHGVRGLVEEVEDRREVEGHAHRRQLRRQGPREAACEVVGTLPPQMRHRRPFGERRPQAGDPPPFLVDPHPQRGLACELPGLEGQLRHLVRRLDVAGEQHHPAEVPLPRERTELHRHRGPAEPGQHHLPHLTMQWTHGRPFLSNRKGCARRARLGPAPAGRRKDDTPRL